MTKRLIHSVLAAVALVGLGGCYQDDSSGPPRGRPLVRVSLTDAPFPYDSVTSVNIYVVRIEASTQLDTSGGGNWVLITEPRKTFDLLGLQQGATAFVGEGRSEEHTSELQSHSDLVCRLLLEKKKYRMRSSDRE